MKQVSGIWLPDGDDHFEAQISAGPLVEGRGTYQLRKYLAALGLVARRGHAVDVGAHVGLWSRVMALDFEHVTAFEPVMDHIQCFRMNVPSRVDLFPCAVGAVAGRAGMLLVAGNSGNARTQAGDAVPMVALDDVAMPTIDLLKIDVEGTERDVVAGAERTIRRDRPVIVVEQKPGHAERYGHGQWDAVRMLQSWGMRQMEVIAGDHVMAW